MNAGGFAMYHDDEFIWLTPQPKNRLTLVIPNENYIIIRPALQTELPAKASIGYIPEKRVIAFRADALSSTACFIPLTFPRRELETDGTPHWMRSKNRR